MSNLYLDSNGLTTLWNKIKGTFVPQTRKINDKALSGDITLTASDVSALPSSTTIPTATTTTPKMDGTAAVGSETKWAKGDHVHPTDTSRAAANHTHGNITNAGLLQTTDVSIADGDKLVITDASDSNKVARSVLAFNKSYTSQFLSRSGDWLTCVRTSRTINGHALSDDIELDAEDIGVDPNAQENVLEGVKLNGTDLTITSKKVNIPVFVGATTSSAGTVGLVPAPSKLASDGTSLKMLFSNGNWYELDVSYSESLRTLALSANSTQLGNVVFPLSSTSVAGMMSSSDKTKLDSITMSNGKIDSSILPSYVDDIIEAYPRSGQTALSQNWLATGSASGTVITPESGKIYVLMAASGDYGVNSQFRWTGSGSTGTYVEIYNTSGFSPIPDATINALS